MRRLRIAGIAVTFAAATIVSAPQAAVAGGETWKVVSVNATGCGVSQNQFTVAFAGEGPDVSNHTLVRSGGLVYMSEDVGTQADSTQSWSLYEDFSYNTPPNPGTWPIPNDQRVWVDFRLEDPKGTIVYSWTVVFESCNTGNVLYNGPTAKDRDRDLIPTPQDRCPTVKEPNRQNGCPLFDRTLTLSYEKQATRFLGFLSAEGARKLQNALPVTVWRVRPGPDQRVGMDLTNRHGKYVLERDAKPGRYYARTPAVLKPLVGEAKAETSQRVQVH